MAPERIAYLDNAASTPLCLEAVEAMAPLHRELYANPTGAHRMARDTRRCIDDARDVMAEALGSQPGEIVFTGGGTEGDNMAVVGRHMQAGGVTVCSAIEHHAVLEPVEHLGGRVVSVDAAGVIDLDALAALRDRLADGILAAVLDTVETGERSGKVAGSAHLCFEGIESEALLFLLEDAGIYASAASSCSSGAQDPSHVLAAMGYDRMLAGGSLRLSLGYETADADIDQALAVIPDSVARLRAYGKG